METRLQQCEKLIREGYGIGIVHYPRHKTTVYSFLKCNDASHRTIKFECARDIAKLLIKNGAKIIYICKNSVALNFIPERIEKGMITMWVTA